MSTFMVVDGTNLVHRAFHALSSTDMRVEGEPIWAVHGLVNMLSKFVALAQPSSLLVAFDSPGGCPWRRSLLPEYKAGRAKSADDLSSQLGSAPVILNAAGIAVSSVPEWEADDILASAVAYAQRFGASSVVVSSDKDAHQLVGERCVVLKPEGLFVDDEAMTAKWGVPGNRWVEFAALCGESSDNIAGVPGVGPKRASALIAAFDDVEDAFADPGRAREVLGESIASKLLAGADVFRRNRTVATLRPDLDVDVANVKISRIDGSNAADVLTSYGMTAAGRRFASTLADLSGMF